MACNHQMQSVLIVWSNICHPNTILQQILQPERAILWKNGKCFAFLKSGHIVWHCLSKFRCPKCGNNYHLLRSFKIQGKYNQDQSPSLQDNQTAPSVNVHVCAKSNTSVLLQTASAMVGKPNDPWQQNRKSKIVFYSCNWKSYISNQLGNAFGL